MKKIFSKEKVFKFCGYYPEERPNQLIKDFGDEISLDQLMNFDISLNNKVYFLFEFCNLSSNEKIDLSLMLDWMVLPIFEEKYPEDKRIRECLEAIELFNLGKISLDELRVKCNAAAAADYSAIHISFDNLGAHYAASAAYFGADSTNPVSACLAADTKTNYSDKLLDIIKDFIK